MTTREDIAAVAGQLADLTRTVKEMEEQLRELRERADLQQERAEKPASTRGNTARANRLRGARTSRVSERLQAAAYRCARQSDHSLGASVPEREGPSAALTCERAARPERQPRNQAARCKNAQRRSSVSCAGLDVPPGHPPRTGLGGTFFLRWFDDEHCELLAVVRLEKSTTCRFGSVLPR